MKLFEVEGARAPVPQLATPLYIRLFLAVFLMSLW